ncbi:hypothetical protein S40288_09490 [Stachybotrys chartarum IBT 40288]|nr:hypothetical protein S40288_09490 [Stachybotrys chartarum IBT 40288]
MADAPSSPFFDRVGPGKELTSPIPLGEIPKENQPAPVAQMDPPTVVVVPSFVNEGTVTTSSIPSPSISETSGSKMSGALTGSGPLGSAGPSCVPVASPERSNIEITGHRRNPKVHTLLEVLVKSGNPIDEPTWEAESSVQERAPVVLFKYWDKVEGGRPPAPEDPLLWHVLRIVDHKFDQSTATMLVEWIGSQELSWEPEKVLKRTALKLLNAYWAGLGGRESVVKTTALAAVPRRRRSSPNTKTEKRGIKKVHRPTRCCRRPLMP